MNKYIFEFHEFIFSENLNELLDFLKLNNIKYRKNRYYIIFKFKINGYKNYFKVKALYENDLIIEYNFSYLLENKNEAKDINRYLEENYQYINYSNIDQKTYYNLGPYEIETKIIEMGIDITVKYHHFEVKKRTKVYNYENLGFFIYSILGLILTISAFVINFNFEYLRLKIGLSVICILYGVFEFVKFFMLEQRSELSYKIAVTVAATLGYIGLLSTIVYVFLIFNSYPLSVNYLFYICYTAPSFLIVLLLLFILMQGI